MAARTLSLYTFLFAIVLALGACKKDDFVIETTDQLVKLATDIQTKVRDADDKKAGVAEAQKLLDEAKGDLAPKMKEVGELRGFQVGEEAMSKLTSGVADATMKVAGLQLDLVSEAAADEELNKALEKLIGDFEKVIEGQS